MIIEYFDLAVTFLHASIQIAIGLFIVCFMLLLFAYVIFYLYEHCRYYKWQKEEIAFLKGEVKRLKVNLFQMGFTDYAPIWLTVEESKDLSGLVQRIEDDTQLTNNEVDVLMCLKERIEQSEMSKQSTQC